MQTKWKCKLPKVFHNNATKKAITEIILNMAYDIGNTAVATQVNVRNGCAEGVEKRKWFVAIVKSRHEKAVRDKLIELGYEAYVATQKEMHVYKCRHRKEIERVIISCYVFVHATENERVATLKECSQIAAYLMELLPKYEVDSDGCWVRKCAVIPDAQMQQLQYFLYHAPKDVSFIAQLKKGDPVRVARGPLKGEIGAYYEDLGKSCLSIILDGLGGVITQIPIEDLEFIEPKK